ncbi:cytochrome d ubiquinol oxidase subunit II [Methylobacterium trifolii]|uniref:Cytochrome bd-I ubiquinol oxidase subunit 2 n=1 Tax=Methylobacterium trifolii TaxID=1003092 RepID=A0ABQ4U0E3_9HYPH|nr:cytochrome d ubiquinol oxidase subunit II [Methylobacterium trifolii]GJE60916.1 Cytochrome bd-I ubiquinol oxidase subunit 2 [Methylobacterium trifolii]
MLGFGMEYAGAAFWLPLVWSALLGLAVAMYVVIDGFDLGVGILFTAARPGNWRDRMMLSVAPIWDGNETWLVLGGGGLFAVFSVAYAILLPALYLPLILMLIALIFRGVAFEFRFKADRSQPVWDYAFHYGSLVATFAQGLVLGAFVQGFKVEGRGFAGGTLDWLTPFSVMTGIGLVCGYGLLGATWCVMKTSGELEIWARLKARQFLAGTVVSMAIVSAWVPFLGLDIQARWLSWPNVLFVAPVPVVTALVCLGILKALAEGRSVAPFLLSIALFLLGFLGLAISLFPYIVPPAMTIWQAANAVSALQFALVGYAVVMPLTLAYTAYAYWVFRGKVAEDGAGGYGH